MQSKITERFWEDEDIATLKTDEKLAVVWLITNAGVNIIGVTEVAPRKFEFDTGLSVEALWRACQALPRACVKDGNSVLMLNFIRHQIGEGESLVDNTNMFKSVRRAFQGVTKEAFRAALLAKYPQLSLPLPSPMKPSQALAGQASPPKPLQGLQSPCKGKEKEKENNKEKEQRGMGSGEGFCPDAAEVFAFAAEFRGELATGTPGPIPPEFAKTWLARMEHRREFPPRWQRALIAEWRAGWNTLAAAPTGTGLQKNAAKNGAPVSASVAAIEARSERLRLEKAVAAELTAEKAANDCGDEQTAYPHRQRRRALEAELKKLGPAAEVEAIQ